MNLTPQNYHSLEANMAYCSVSQYKEFVGTMGRPSCEARALARLRGEWQEEKTTALLVGSFVDAYFEKTLDAFKIENPDIFKKDGGLKAEYTRALEIIDRMERDQYLMTCLSGEKQVIMTAELYGFPWKIKIDSYHAKRALVDLKIMKCLTEFFWVKDYGKIPFVEYWGYDLQGAVYQRVCELSTGDRLPFVIAAASKEKEPDIEVIGFDQPRFNDVIREIEPNLPRIFAIKEGREKPEKCGFCDYCRRNKVLSKPIHYTELVERL